ncbi:hypothetical protein CHS0354_036307 [Potamilus streckersoni]|uniref:Uncharacterized protein n=1 Tax=Potamilus streckersoni TaxID=2493646 RepID=A0AAE0W8V2_9BIVA|nr:hypothetical protein CHS0354_036307 [Potamilus streckersoni]
MLYHPSAPPSLILVSPMGPKTGFLIDANFIRQGSFIVLVSPMSPRAGAKAQATPSGSSLQQHDFPSYSSLGGSTYSDGSMSRYTRTYDTGSRNYDTSTRSYDSSSRLHDRSTRLGVSGSEEATESASRRHGLHSARGHDSDLTSYDVSTRKYDIGGTGSDIASSHPTSFGISGLRDSTTEHLHEPVLLDPGLRKTFQRHRNGSGDSIGSQSSDRSETKSQDSTDLFRIYRSRYQDRATHGQEPVSTSYKEPSVSYSAPKKQTNLDIDPIPELESVEKAQNGERAREKERSDSLRTQSLNSISSSREEREDKSVNQRLSERFKEGKIERSDFVQSRDTQSRLDSIQSKDIHSRSSIKDRDHYTAGSSRLLEKNKEGVEFLRFRDSKSTKKETAELQGEPQGSKQSSDKSGDELLSNFRKAIRKHASTDERKEKGSESSRSSTQLDKNIHSGDSKLEEIKEKDNLPHKISQKKFEIEKVSSSDQGKSVLQRYQKSESIESKSEETGEARVTDKNKERIAFEGPVIDDRSSRKVKAYVKSKTADLGQLSQDTKEDEVPSRVDATLITAHSRDELSEMTREERISRYKEERKRQLAALAETFDSGKSDLEALPSLFLSQTSQTSPLARSQSLKEETDLQAAVNLSRSRSMKEDSEKLKPVEEEKKQRINRDEHEYRHSEEKQHSRDFVDDDHIPSPSFKPLGITGLSLAERASEILGADQLPQKKAPLDSRLFDHMQNLRKLQQRHRAKERISIDELKARRSSRDTEDLEAMHALSAKEVKDEQKKDKLSQRVVEKRPKDEKAEINSADSEREKLKSRMRRKLPSIEDVLGTSSGSSTPDTMQSSSPAHVGSISSQSSLSTQSSSSQILSSRTSSSGSDVSTSRASSSLSDASRCSRILTPSTISEDVFHDTQVRKMDVQDQKGDQVMRSRTPSGGQPISDSAKAVTHHKVSETSSTRVERNKAQEVKPFGTVYVGTRDKDQHEVKSCQEEQKQSVKIPVTNISYRDLERETKSSHVIEKETIHSTASDLKHKPYSDFMHSDKTQEKTTQQVLSSKEHEKRPFEDKKEQDFVTVERDSKTASKHIESGKARYLENIVMTSDMDSKQLPSKKDFGVSYIGTGTEESTKKDDRKRSAQDVNTDPNLLLEKTPIILDSVDGDGKKRESKKRGKQVEIKSLLHDSSRSGSVSQTKVEPKERIVPTSSQQSHEKETKDNLRKVSEEKSDLTRLPLNLERKEIQRSQEKEPVSVSHLVSSSSLSFQTNTDGQRPEAKPTISQKSFEKSRREFGDIGFPSVSYQRRTPERRMESVESELKQPLQLQQAGIDTVKHHIQQAGINMGKQPVQQTGGNTAKLIAKSAENKTEVGTSISYAKIDEKGAESKIHLLSSKKTPDISDLKVEIRPTSNSVTDSPFTDLEKKIEIPETRTVKLSRKPRIGEDTKVAHKYLASREAPVVHLPRKENLDRKEVETQIQINEAKTVTGSVISTEESSVVQDRILQKSVQGGVVTSEENFPQPPKTAEFKGVHAENIKSVHQIPKSNIEEYDIEPEKHLVAQIQPGSTVSQITFQTLESKTVDQNKQETLSVESRINESLESKIVPLSFEKILHAETVSDKHRDESAGAIKVLAHLEDGKAEILSRVNDDISVLKKELSINPTIPAVAQLIDAKLEKEGSQFTDAKTLPQSPSSHQASKDVKEMVVEVSGTPATVAMPVPLATVELIRTLVVSSAKEKSASVERKPSKGKKSKTKLASEKKKGLTEKRAGGLPLTLLDTTLDDILGKNLEYLSDVEAQEIFNRKSKADAITRPKSIHEDSPKTSLKKQALKKSQSMPEQRDLPIIDADEDIESEVSVIPKDPVQVKSIEPKLADVKITKAVLVDRHVEAVEKRPEATTSAERQVHTTPDGSKVTKSGLQTALSSDKKLEFKVENQSRSEKFKDGETCSLVSKEAIDAQKFAGGLAEKSQPFSGGSAELTTLFYVDTTKPSENARSTGDIIEAKGSLSLCDVVSSQKKDVTTSLTPFTSLDDVTTRMEVTSFYSDTQTSDASDRSETRAQDLDFVKQDISRMTTTDSDSLSQASYSSQTSDASRKKRKDKTAQRKSKLNEGDVGALYNCNIHILCVCV